MQSPAKYLALAAVVCLAACGQRVPDDGDYLVAEAASPDGTLTLEVFPEAPPPDEAADEGARTDSTLAEAYRITVRIRDAGGAERETAAQVFPASPAGPEPIDARLQAVVDMLGGAPRGLRNDLAFELAERLQLRSPNERLRSAILALMEATGNPIPGAAAQRIDKAGFGAPGWSFPSPSRTSSASTTSQPAACNNRCPLRPRARETEINRASVHCFEAGQYLELRFQYCDEPSDTCRSETETYVCMGSAHDLGAPAPRPTQTRSPTQCTVPVITHHFNQGTVDPGGCFTSTDFPWRDPLQREGYIGPYVNTQYREIP